MFWFILAFAAIAVSIVITIKRPLWGSLAGGLCSGVIGFKAGALVDIGRWPTFIEGLVLVGLTGLSCVVLRRKRQAWEKAARTRIIELKRLQERLQTLAQLAQRLQQESQTG